MIRDQPRKTPLQKLMALSRLVGISSFMKKLIHRDMDSGSYQPLLPAKTHGLISKTKVARRGHVAVYVGEKEKRYEVPVEYLKLPDLIKLMKHQGDEILEEKIDGPLRVYCSTELFDDLLLKLECMVKEMEHL